MTEQHRSAPEPTQHPIDPALDSLGEELGLTPGQRKMLSLYV